MKCVFQPLTISKSGCPFNVSCFLQPSRTRELPVDHENAHMPSLHHPLTSFRWQVLTDVAQCIKMSKKYLFIWLRWVLATTCRHLVGACGIKFPDQGLNRGPLHRGRGVLAIDHQGSPSLYQFFVLCYVFVFSLRNICPLQSCLDTHPELLQTVTVFIFMRGSLLHF